MNKFKQIVPKFFFVAAAMSLSGCVSNDALFGDFDRAPTHASDRYPITVVNGPQGAHAQVAPCGNWNSDLTDTKDNKPYENLGCAIQHNIAAEIDDPSTINNPRAKTVKNANTEVAAVLRSESYVNRVTLPGNYPYAP